MKHRLVLPLLPILAVLLAPALASAADVYEGYKRIGKVEAAPGARYDISFGYSRVGSTKTASGGRWNVDEGYSRIGYVRRSSVGAAVDAVSADVLLDARTDSHAT